MPDIVDPGLGTLNIDKDHDSGQILPKTTAETRKGPRKGTSWKEVQQVDEIQDNAVEGQLQQAPPLEQNAQEATDGIQTAASGLSEPDEIRFKDLDTGKEFIVPKKHTIRDLSTGQLFALCKDSPTATAAAEDPTGMQYFTDFTSGKEVSPEELDVLLGLRPNPKNLRRISGSSSRRTSNSQGEGIGKKTKSWLKNPFKGRGRRQDFEESDSESPNSTPKVGDESLHGLGQVKVTVHRKASKELSNLQRVQEIAAHSGTVWAMKFSRDGKYLATAGRDTKVYVWEVVTASSEPVAEASAEDPSRQNSADTGLGSRQNSAHSPGYGRSDSGRDSVFKSSPVKAFIGHERDVLDLSWSSSAFLLSASMDTTVRLWYITVNECLRVFRHTDFVTALDFHPTDEKYFVSGSLDGKIRMWNIPEKANGVIDYADVHEIVTAVVFSADGSQVVVGTMKGKCQFFTCNSERKLQYQAQIDVKNRRGNAAKKISGIQFVPNNPQQIMITSNDSRIRVYEHYTLLCKYKGLHNANTQIKASFSPDGSYIICGSDHGECFVWPNIGAGRKPIQISAPLDHVAEKCSAYESFQAHSEIATVAIFAPHSLQRLLQEKAKSEGRTAFQDTQASASPLSSAYILTAGLDGNIRVFANLV